MEFFEFVLVFSVAFVLPLTIIKLSLDYKKAKVQALAGGAEGSGVTAGELKRFLRDAIEDANAPLMARLDDLELAVLGDQADAMAIDDEFESGPRREQERTLGRRVAE